MDQATPSYSPEESLPPQRESVDETIKTLGNIDMSYVIPAKNYKQDSVRLSIMREDHPLSAAPCACEHDVSRVNASIGWAIHGQTAWPENQAAMRSVWLDKVIDSVADRGRDLLGIRSDRVQSNLENLCNALLAQKGEASGTALAREILRNYQRLSTARKLDFFTLMDRRFGPDKNAIFAAASAFRQSGSAQSWLALGEAIEPQRQRLFRRLNTAPDGTRALIGMRADLLKLQGDNPALEAVADFHLSNGAQLERINPFANPSADGLRQSAGLMVNYRYISQDFESNHEAFAQHKKIRLSRPLQKAGKAVREAWASRH